MGSTNLPCDQTPVPMSVREREGTIHHCAKRVANCSAAPARGASSKAPKIHVHVDSLNKTETDLQQGRTANNLKNRLPVGNLHVCIGPAVKTDMSQRPNQSSYALQALLQAPTVNHPDAIVEHTLFQKWPHKMVRQHQVNHRVVTAEPATRFGWSWWECRRKSVAL